MSNDHVKVPVQQNASQMDGAALKDAVSNDNAKSEAREEVDVELHEKDSNSKSEHASSETVSQCGDPTSNDIQDAELGLQRTQTPLFSVFSKKQKSFIVFMVAFAGFFSPLSANIYFPALNTLANHFHVSNSTINLTLTSYMILQGLAPTVIGDLSDMAGRRPAYVICFTIYIGACIGIALCDSFAALLILRCMQSAGSSGTIALASGVVADIATSSERGIWMGWATSGPMVAPALAPVLGGIFAEFLGWRWIFWFLVILAAAFTVPLLITFPETGRNVVGNGSIPPQGWNMSVLNWLQLRKQRRESSKPGLHRTLSVQSKQTLAKQRKLRFPNPLKVLPLLLEKDVSLLLFFNSLVYCAFYDVMASAPTLLEQIYGFNALQIGLCFLPMGAGCLLAPALVGRLMDWNFRRLAKRIGYTIVKGKANDLRNFPLERCRIGVALPLVFIEDIAILCYGWTMQAETNLAAPLVFMFFIGLAGTGAFNCMNVMLVDLYPLSPATATSANNLVRCLMGAGATAVIVFMIDAMGRGWAFTFVAGVVVLFSPILWVLEKWGPKWREARRAKVEELKRRHDEGAAEKAG